MIAKKEALQRLQIILPLKRNKGTTVGEMRIRVTNDN